MSPLLHPGKLRRVAVAALALALVGVGCASAERATLVDDAPAESEDSETTELEEAPDPSEQLFPNVIEVNFSRQGAGPYTFEVTVSSPYDTPERYADAWRVVGLDGTIFGTRELTHDHQSEQPFTRSLNGIEIPDDVTDIVVEARDSVNGWGGGTVDIRLDPAA